MPSVFNSRLKVPILLAGILGLAISDVEAHGYVSSVNIDGTAYTGWLPFVDPYTDPIPERIVRRVISDAPVLNNTDPSMACNVDGAQGAALVADVNGGSKVTFTWNTWPTDHHGPVTTYMASCNGDCKTLDAGNAEFFKIDQAGYIGPGQFWASDELIANNFSWTVTIPKTLEDGQYLIRHEILALHSIGQPQYYPSCTQVAVNNGGSSVPSASELVKATDIYDGVTFPDIWEGVTSFTIAGPPVATLVAGGGSNNNNAQPAPASDEPGSAASPAEVQSAQPASSTSDSSGNTTGSTTSSKSCRRGLLKKRNASSFLKRHTRFRTRRLSRHEGKGISF